MLVIKTSLGSKDSHKMTSLKMPMIIPTLEGKRDKSSDTILDRNCSNTVAAFLTGNRVPDCTLARFARVSISIDDEERVIMEACLFSRFGNWRSFSK